MHNIAYMNELNQHTVILRAFQFIRLCITASQAHSKLAHKLGCKQVNILSNGITSNNQKGLR